MSADRPYVEENARERDRLRALVERLTDEELQRPVYERWTVAGVLGHIAFWDGRALALGRKLQRGDPFTESDTEPEDVDWINDAASPLIHAIPPSDAAQLALRIAEETDALMASLPPERLYPADPESPINAVRADHRGEHLDDIERALGTQPTR
jgi:Mycothiol maleylpyruvate isomerase N-terminal domain